MYDNIDQLPSDDSPMGQNETNTIETFFKEKNKGLMKSLFKDMKLAILAAVLFVIFSLPHVDSFILSVAPQAIAGFSYAIIAIKIVLIILTFYFISNLSMMKK
jgi:hypothetical protein